METLTIVIDTSLHNKNQVQAEDDSRYNLISLFQELVTNQVVESSHRYMMERISNRNK